MKFTDVNPFNKKIQKRINKSILDTVKKKDFILGHNVKKFEKKFSSLSKSKYAVGCATGTDALILALKSLNLKPNHEVIIPGMSYISTGLSAALNNNKIVFMLSYFFVGLWFLLYVFVLYRYLLLCC